MAVRSRPGACLILLGYSFELSCVTQKAHGQNLLCLTCFAPCCLLLFALHPRCTEHRRGRPAARHELWRHIFFDSASQLPSTRAPKPVSMSGACFSVFSVKERAIRTRCYSQRSTGQIQRGKPTRCRQMAEAGGSVKRTMQGLVPTIPTGHNDSPQYTKTNGSSTGSRTLGSPQLGFLNNGTQMTATRPRGRTPPPPQPQTNSLSEFATHPRHPLADRTTDAKKTVPPPPPPPARSSTSNTIK